MTTSKLGGWRELRSFTRLYRALRFIPLGLLWGLVAGAFHTLHMIAVDERNFYFHGVEFNDVFLVMMLSVIATGPIATVLGNTLLKPGLSATTWIGNWVITAVASGVGGVALLCLVIVLWRISMWPPQAVFSDLLTIIIILTLTILAGVVPFIIFTILISIELTAVALILAPLSLLIRWLILRRASVAEPAGGASHTQP